MNTFIPEVPAAFEASASASAQRSPAFVVDTNFQKVVTFASSGVNTYAPDEELTEQEQLELLHTFITYQQQGPGAFTPHEEFMKELFDDDISHSMG